MATVGKRIKTGLRKFADDLKAGKPIKATRLKKVDVNGVPAYVREEVSLRARRPHAKMGNSTHFPGSRNVGKKRGKVKNTDKPIGQIALFLLWKLDRLGWSPEDFATRLDKAGLEDKTHEAVRKWLNGSNAPRLTEMNTVAKVLGYEDWVAFIVAVGKHHKRPS